jgi:hypothetical protein
MAVVWNSTLEGYNQWLYIKDKMISELHIRKASKTSLRLLLIRANITTTATGKAKSFYVDTECQAEHKGIVNNHSTYFNI